MTIGPDDIIVYANDTYGNTAVSQTISFTIEKPKPAVPFPTAVVGAVSASAAIAIIGIFLYLRKRRGMQGKKW